MRKIFIIIFILFISCSKEDNSALIAQYEEQISNYNSKINDLTNQVSDLTNQVSGLNSQLNNSQAENNNLTNNNNSLNEQLSEVQNSNTEIQSLYDELLSLYDIIEEDYNALAESVSTVSIVSLSSQNSLLYEQIDALTQQIETLTLQLIDSRLETSTSNETIQSLLEQLGNVTSTTASPTTSETTTSETTTSETTSSETTSSGSTSSGSTSSETTVQYQLTVNTDDRGSVSSTGGTYDSGSNISVTASANSGSVFVNWTDSSGNVLSTNTTYSTQINADLTISANFVEIPKTYVPDDAFEQRFIDLGYDDVLDDYVYTNDINNSGVYSFSFNGAAINDVTGLEDFTYLTYLSINGGFTSFSIPETLTSLNTLYIGTTPNLTSLSLSNTVLQQLHFNGQTGIGSTVDTSNLPNLKVYSDSNMSQETGITTLDFSNNPELMDLNIHHSQVTSLNISANNKLNAVFVYNTSISGVFDISHIKITADVRINNTQITCLKVRQEQLDKKDEFLASNSGGAGGTVGLWRLNDATVSTTCD